MLNVYSTGSGIGPISSTMQTIIMGASGGMPSHGAGVNSVQLQSQQLQEALGTGGPATTTTFSFSGGQGTQFVTGSSSSIGGGGGVATTSSFGLGGSQNLVPSNVTFQSLFGGDDLLVSGNDEEMENARGVVISSYAMDEVEDEGADQHLQLNGGTGTVPTVDLNDSSDDDDGE